MNPVPEGTIVPPGPLRATAATVLSATAATVLTGAGQRLPASVRGRWARTNHAGREVTLLEGPVAVAAALVGIRAAGPVGRPSAVLVVLVPGIFGGLDDLVGDPGTKGLLGHLAALGAGRVTTGATKILGIGAAALLTALLERNALRDLLSDAPSDPPWDPPWARVRPRTRVGLDAVVIAGSAHLVNLFDLRPGRALKVVIAAALPLLGPVASRPLAGTLLGTALALGPRDLAGTAMLGDCGAHALGGLLGLGLTRATGTKGALLAAGSLLALTLASERTSFTGVIESTPWLRRLDDWGRRR